jgi:Peptidase_C39 like family
MRTRLLLALALVAAVSVLPGPAEATAPARHIAVTHWTKGADFATGTGDGVEVREGALAIGTPSGRAGGQEHATWSSPWTTPGFTLTELIPSWRALTPGASSIRVEVRGRTSDRTGSWDTIAHWAFTDRAVDRSSGAGQTDDLGRVAYDTWVTGGVTAYQVRVTLLRPVDSTAQPTVDAVDVMASRLPAVSSVPTSAVGDRTDPALGTVLAVPRYSQMVHEGEYPQYDGGGEAWCSPTSTTMVLGYYRALPPPRTYSWVRDDDPDPEVAHAARRTYDANLGGTGNWAFNTAYAAGTTPQAFVTRLRSLREAERFIAAGIPLVASVTFGRGELDGAPISSTNGHLLVIVGFRDNGDVVVNDPAAASRAGVRRTYDRGQFEDAWLKRYSSGSSLRGSGGLVYVIRDTAHPLPDRGNNRNW